MAEVVYAGSPALNKPLQNALNRWLVFLGAKPLLSPDGIFGDQTWLRLRQVVAGGLAGPELLSELFGPDGSPGFRADHPEDFSSMEGQVAAATALLNASADAAGLPPAPYITWPYPSGGPAATTQQVADAKAKMAALGVSSDLGGANTALWVVAGLLAASALGLVAWKVWGKKNRRRGRGVRHATVYEGRGRERRVALYGVKSIKEASR